MGKVSIVIPAYNEEGRIGDVVSSLVDDYDVLVVDDCSDDRTGEIAEEEGARVLRNEENRGYLGSVKRGLEEVDGHIIVTMDADGEHKPEDVEKLVQAVVEEDYDLVFGAREVIPRPSERFLNWLARLKVDVSDTGVGFRAMKKWLAKDLKLDTSCTCGTLALEAKKKGAKIGEVEAKTKKIEKPRRILWSHFIQFFHVLRYLV